jgi:hypothetical protein
MQPRFSILIIAAALAAVAIAAPTYATSRLSMKRATATVAKVKKRELANDFGLKKIIGGPFVLGRTQCSRVAAARVSCDYDATATEPNADGNYAKCAISVRVRAHSPHARWSRHLAACSIP